MCEGKGSNCDICPVVVVTVGGRPWEMLGEVVVDCQLDELDLVELEVDCGEFG